MGFDFSVKEVNSIISGLYVKAMVEDRLRPEQAFFYVQEESGYICAPAEIGLYTVLQTAIFGVGMKYGLELSKESPDTEDVLEILAETYRNCSIDDLEKIGLEGAALAEVIDSMEKVRKKFLQPG